MNPRLLSFLTLFTATGCQEWSHFRSDSLFENKPIDTSKTPVASVAVAARVDQVGRQLIAQNPFIGVEPTFHTVGGKKLQLFHPDLSGVVISEGLVDRCKTDDELAAVLAVELGKMSVERQTANRLRSPGTLPPLNDSGVVSPGGIPADQNQLGTQAIFDKKLQPAGRPHSSPAKDATTIAKEILSAAGFDAKTLPTIQPTLEEIEKQRPDHDAIGGRKNQPRWTN